MKHSFLNDMNIIKDFLEKKLNNDYTISIQGNSIEIRKNDYSLLLQIDYYESRGDYPIIKLFFSTYVTNIFIDTKEICYDANKIIHFSNGEDYLWITTDNEYISEDKLEILVNSVKNIFNVNETVQPFLQKIINRSY